MTGFFRGRLWLWELSAVAWLLLLPYIMTAHGHLDWSGHALGRDFVNYWTAGQLVREGHPLTAFEPPAFLAAEHRLFDPALPFHFWSYPPPGLLVAAPLGLLPYVPGLIAWSLAGLAVLAPALRAFFGERRQWVLALFAPAAAINVALGQNGALTAALLIGGLALWRDRPLVSGALLGLLVFKPQIAILLPVAVLAERRWRTMGAAAASAIAVCLLSTLLFGIEAWRAFFGPTLHMQGVMLRTGLGPFQWMMPSTFMAGRLLGLHAVDAMAVQLPVSLAAAWLTWRGWRSEAPFEVKAALLMTATFAASPQAFNYDLIPAACAALVLWRRARTEVGRGFALALWGLPLLMIALQTMDALSTDLYALKLTTLLAPAILCGGTLTLYRLCAPESPSRAANASTAGEVASNT